MTTANPVRTTNKMPATAPVKLAANATNESGSDLDTLLWRLRARIEANTSLGTMIGLTSCGTKCGVTTLATNLAIRAANNHMGPVLLIDANMSAPRLHRIFRQDAKAGLADLLTGTSTPEEAIRPTSVEELDLLPVGSKEAVRGGRVVPENYGDIASWIRDRYRTVFVDLPSIETMRHSLFLARLLDTTIVAVRSEATSKANVESAVQRMKEDGVNVGGMVLTRRRVYTPGWLRNA